MSLQTLFKLYGGQRHPRIETYEVLQERGYLTEYRYIPHGATVIYISHEWVGSEHPDPRGDQMYHLLLLLERLQRGDVDRTDMDWVHILVYKHNYTTSAGEWKRMLDPEKTFIFYDGFSISEEEREQGFQMVPEFVQRCNFMIVLAPGCTHFDKIDPSTGRKMNLCYRTYRLSAKCVFEMFSSFLTTKGGEQVRPALLVRSGKGTPNWSSPMECQKLAVGTSSFQCCATNHTLIQSCRRPIYLSSLVHIDRKKSSLALSSLEFWTSARLIVLYKLLVQRLD